MFNEVIFLIFRRMRVPLIILVLSYAISIVGFTLIPGQDDQGNPWHMDFFHAFYFVSFMGSTIGFGEIPYPFTDAQRYWTIFTIYLTVIAWLYGIGTLISLIQEPAFRRAITHARFVHSVRRLREPFFLVCGYGDTGEHLVRVMVDRHHQAVVVDIDPQRIDHLEISQLPMDVPGLAADAADPTILDDAGLRHPACKGVVALTNDDSANLHIALAGRLLAPDERIIVRAESREAVANLHSFGIHDVINPYDSFAEWLAMAIHSPSLYLIHDWMIGLYRRPLTDLLQPPKGLWIVCGYGRFGKAVYENLRREGVEVVVVDAFPDRNRVPEGTIVGRGTEAKTLQEAGIGQAVGIVAGTNDDADNLSIILTARELKPEIFTVARQNRSRNGALFDSVLSPERGGRHGLLDLVMQPAEMMAQKVVALMMSPMLVRFLAHARQQDNEWANVLVSRIIDVTGEEEHPITWRIKITPEGAPALYEMLSEGRQVLLDDLEHDPRYREKRLHVVPLMIERPGEGDLILPEMDEPLRLGDRILFAGLPEAHGSMALLVHNYSALEYVITGIERPDGVVWRWVDAWRNRKGRERAGT